MTIYYADALRALYPDAKWAMRSNSVDYEFLSWQDETEPKPTKEVLDLTVVTLQTEWDLTQYARDRETAYNERGSTIQNLSVAMVESMDGTDPQKLIDLQVIRAQVKQDFPKP